MTLTKIWNKPIGFNSVSNRFPIGSSYSTSIFDINSSIRNKYFNIEIHSQKEISRERFWIGLGSVLVRFLGLPFDIWFVIVESAEAEPGEVDVQHPRRGHDMVDLTGVDISQMGRHFNFFVQTEKWQRCNNTRNWTSRRGFVFFLLSTDFFNRVEKWSEMKLVVALSSSG